MARHPQLKGCFSWPRTGHRLQFLESEIMMRILRGCKSEGIVALPVFDCVVVKTAMSFPAQVIMKREFKAETGLDAEVRFDEA